jgi:hypothetical protein
MFRQEEFEQDDCDFYTPTWEGQVTDGRRTKDRGAWSRGRDEINVTADVRRK